MIPKKSSNLYKEVSEELGLNESLIEDCIEFYYKTLRQQMVDLKELRLNVDGLGHFVVKPMLVKQTIPRLEKALETHDTSTFNAYFNKKGKETKLDQLRKLQKKLNFEEERKLNHQKRKDEYTKKNMEGTSQDNGGN